MDKIYECPFCNKIFDNPYKLGGHKIRCKLNPKYKQIQDNWNESRKIHNDYSKEQILYCKYCEKECKSKNSLDNHERLCKLNPNRQYTNFNNDYNRTRKSTNQYIKAKEKGYEYKISEETKQKFSKIWLGKSLPQEMKILIQTTINNKILNNTWHNNYGVKILYNNCYFDSLWEVKFVQYLDNKNILWERPKKSFKYFWNNSYHNYYPDIYLPEYNLYIEIKGIPSERDYEKWNQFTGNLDIYDGEDLFKLNILNSFDKRYIIKEEFKFKHIKL